jgi:hypothetical protein
MTGLEAREKVRSLGSSWSNPGSMDFEPGESFHGALRDKLFNHDYPLSSGLTGI